MPLRTREYNFFCVLWSFGSSRHSFFSSDALFFRISARPRTAAAAAAAAAGATSRRCKNTDDAVLKALGASCPLLVEVRSLCSGQANLSGGLPAGEFANPLADCCLVLLVFSLPRRVCDNWLTALRRRATFLRGRQYATITLIRPANSHRWT
jgi:hypothetical protein